MILGRLNSKIFKAFSILFLIVNFSFSQTIKNKSKIKIIGDIPVPEGYSRIISEKNSFSNWIRKLSLKPTNSPVRDFRNKIFKTRKDTTVAAVIDWDIKGKRLEQCMDILVRFYAEYLWENNQQKGLILPLPGKQKLRWSNWMHGFRPKFRGINFKLVKTAPIDSTKNNFDKYLTLIFAESHTQQFYHAYPPIHRNRVKAGDYIVKKGVKGHAVLIVDLARNNKGDLVALIGQGDTPACEFYLLNFEKGNPWFPLNFSEDVLPLPINKKMRWNGLRRFE